MEQLTAFIYSLKITHLKRKLEESTKQENAENWRRFKEILTEAEQMQADIEISDAAKSFVKKFLEISPEIALS